MRSLRRVESTRRLLTFELLLEDSNSPQQQQHPT